jgi:hypothetical protein
MLFAKHIGSEAKSSARGLRCRASRPPRPLCGRRGYLAWTAIDADNKLIVSGSLAVAIIHLDERALARGAHFAASRLDAPFIIHLRQRKCTSAGGVGANAHVAKSGPTCNEARKAPWRGRARPVLALLAGCCADCDRRSAWAAAQPRSGRAPPSRRDRGKSRRPDWCCAGPMAWQRQPPQSISLRVQEAAGGLCHVVGAQSR